MICFINNESLRQKLQNVVQELFMKIDLYLKTLTINIEKFLTFKVDVLNSSGAKALIKQDDQSQKSGYVY
ncbi:hypothetical protein T08_14338 [Trichinella sp. T8]|nr:hypothetical protein T08_14338 [Trichinella sp. T8]